MKWFTSDFEHPKTGGLCRFCWNATDETIQMQPSPTALRDGFSPSWESTKAICTNWGVHSCGSQQGAGRVIHSSFPEICLQWNQEGKTVWTPKSK